MKKGLMFIILCVGFFFGFVNLIEYGLTELNKDGYTAKPTEIAQVRKYNNSLISNKKSKNKKRSKMQFNSGFIVVNHNDVDVKKVPVSYIEKAKQNFKVFYGHTSHGSQITSGMKALRATNVSLYNFNNTGAGALKYVETKGDLGHKGNTKWAQTTRQYLRNNHDINVVMWSWCGGCSSNTVAGIDIYLQEMTKLEGEFPKVKFIYMTGHLDGSGINGNLHKRNEQIRNYCRKYGKTLFDFANIESYDPSGKEFLSKYAKDTCNYKTGNWATEWINKHPNHNYNLPKYAAHTHPLNAAMKGNAFWVLLAKLAGWQG